MYYSNHRTSLFLSTIVILVIVSGCDNETSSQPKSNESSNKTSSTSGTNSPSKQSSGLSRTAPTEKASNYKIINEDILPGIKRSLDIRLNKKVSEETLRSIAVELKNLDRRHYERTFICYYLPDMQVGEGAWATTHFDPDLTVHIQGLTIENETALI